MLITRVSPLAAVVDRDTSPANITFVIVSAQAGYLAYFANLNATIDKFTQADINAGRITFVHSGTEYVFVIRISFDDRAYTHEYVT